MALSDMLTDTMTIKAKANTRAANAGFGRSESEKATCIPCMVMDNAGGQAYIAGSRAQINDHPIVTEYSDIDNGDTVEITSRGATVTCRVNGVDERRARGGIDAFYVLDVQAIEN